MTSSKHVAAAATAPSWPAASPPSAAKSFFKLEGSFSVAGGKDAAGYVPMVFPLSEARIPMPGSYRIVFEGTGLERVDIRFYANSTTMPSLDDAEGDQ